MPAGIYMIDAPMIGKKAKIIIKNDHSIEELILNI